MNTNNLTICVHNVVYHVVQVGLRVQSTIALLTIVGVKNHTRRCSSQFWRNESF